MYVRTPSLLALVLACLLVLAWPFHHSFAQSLPNAQEQSPAPQGNPGSSLLPAETEAESADGQVFQTGDVFAAVSNGNVNWYRSDGTLVKVLRTGRSGFTTGMAFDASGVLYVTGFNDGIVSCFDKQGNLLGQFGSGYSGNPESILFDAAGSVYIGAVDGDNDIRKFSSSGELLDKFDVVTGPRGSDWIDLAKDQCTMLYTSEGSVIRRYDVCGKRQLTDFGTGLAESFALRILPDGRVLVANHENILLLSAIGQVLRTYDAPGEDSWFALNLDPDGTSFWSGVTTSGNAYRFDIETGVVRLGPLSACGSSCLYGLAIYRESSESSFRMNLPFGLPSTALRRDGTDRINSYYDHEYPVLRGNEPNDPAIDDTILIYTGDRYPDAWDIADNPAAKWYSGHDGYDFPGVNGKTEVLAAHGGQATSETVRCHGDTNPNDQIDDTLYMKQVTVTRGRYKTVYLHVAEDDLWRSWLGEPHDGNHDVEAGDPIAHVGNTGYPDCSTGAHLHFAVYYDLNNNGTFERTEKIDPYGFPSTKIDPWTQPGYDGPESRWLWSFDLPAQTTVLPQNSYALNSGSVNVVIPSGAVTQQAVALLSTVPDPQPVASTQSRRQHTPGQIGIGPTYRLLLTTSDGGSIVETSAPLTLAFRYSDLDTSHVDSSTLQLYRWNEADGWELMGGNLDTLNGVITASTSQPGTFALRGVGLAPAPALTEVSPSVTLEGRSVSLIISGRDFQQTPLVFLGPTQLPVEYVSPTEFRRASFRPASRCVCYANREPRCAGSRGASCVHC